MFRCQATIAFILLCLFFVHVSCSDSYPQDEEDALVQLSDDWNLGNDGLKIWTNRPILLNYCNSRHLICNTNHSVTSLILSFITLYHAPNPVVPSYINAFRNLQTLDLRRTKLGGDIPKEIGELSKLTLIDLDYTQIVSIPPEIGNLTELISFQANGCRLRSLPAEFLKLQKLEIVHLLDNQLTGTIPHEFAKMSHLKELALGNFLSGSIPSAISTLPNLSVLSLPGNRLTGTLPEQWSTKLMQIELSANRLNGSIPSSLCGLPDLTELNLGNNELIGPISECLSKVLSPKLQSLSLRSNHLNGTIPDFTPWSDCVSLNKHLSLIDLSHNELEGTIPLPSEFCQVSNFSLSHNRLSGKLGDGFQLLSPRFFDVSNNQLSGNFQLFRYWSTFLQRLDISNNLFAFDVSQFSSFAQLSYLNCSKNQLTGADPVNSTIAIPQLKLMDLSHNNLSQTLNIQNWIGRSMDLIDVSGNPHLPKLTLPEVIKDNLKSFRLSDRGPFECAELQIPGVSRFIYDQGLFNLTECHCSPGYFGTPPACHLCNFTQQGITCLGSQNLSIPEHWYPITAHDEAQFESCVTIYSSKSPCTAPAYLKADTNGIQIVGSVCQTGSTGRKCTDCICNSTKCYFRRGPECRECKDLMNKSVFGVVVAVVVIVVLVFVTFVFYQSLDLRRRQLVPWSELALWRRVLYRAKSAALCGMTKILISFVQSVTVLASWDVYLELTWLKIMNAMNFGRWGIRCYFRSLADFTTDFYLHMAIPLIATVVLGLTVGLASLIWRLKHRSKQSEQRGYEILSVQSESQKNQKSGQYSAWSLWVSSVISVMMFLYFGLSLSVVANFICEEQPLSREKYLLTYPWQLCSEIRSLQRLSIIPLLLYVVGIPFVYGMILLFIWKRLTNTKVQDYFYPLYRTYRQPVSWYGLIVITRMFLLAVVLRVTSERDPKHAYFVVMILSISLAVQFICKPWKGRYENIAERVSLLLCIVTFMLRLAPNEDSESAVGGSVLKWFPLQILMIVLNSLYVVVMLVLMIWRSMKEPCEYHDLYASSLKSEERLISSDEFVYFESVKSKVGSESDEMVRSDLDDQMVSDTENETERQ